MKNLEQIRARNALKCPTATGEHGGEVVKKIPPLIMNHGLLASAAFAYEEKKQGYSKNSATKALSPAAFAYEEKKPGYAVVFDHIAKHLSDPEVAILNPSSTDLQKMMTELTEGDSNLLRKATNEAMAWLTYARRFVKKA